MRTACRLLWEFCEATGINLGRFAPWVFGKMIGCKGRRVNERKDHGS